MITYTYGVMGSGKSAKLINDYHNRGENRDIAFVLKLTNKEGLNTGWIKSRNGSSLKCDGRILQEKENVYNKINDIIKRKNIKSIYIDEVQFLTRGQMKDLVRAAKRFNIDIHCYGLLRDNNRQLFEGINYLLGESHRKYKLIGYCECGEIATVNAKFYDPANKRYYYKAVCDKCEKNEGDNYEQRTV